jgi:hypothetical protein
MGRASKAKKRGRGESSNGVTDATRADPPMEPLDGTIKWIESKPDALSNDPGMAGLMVRIGMAVNALTVHVHFGYLASRQKADAVRQRDNMVSLVMAASLAFEAIVLANENQSRLRPLLERVGDKGALLSRVGRLLSGTHPASGLLERARNSLGFHWDYKDEFIGPVINDFTKNDMIVWVEEVPPPESHTVHRLSVEVLTHALLPDVGAHSDP